MVPVSSRDGPDKFVRRTMTEGYDRCKVALKSLSPATIDGLAHLHRELHANRIATLRKHKEPASPGRGLAGFGLMDAGSSEKVGHWVTNRICCGDDQSRGESMFFVVTGKGLNGLVAVTCETAAAAVEKARALISAGVLDVLIADADGRQHLPDDFHCLLLGIQPL